MRSPFYEYQKESHAEFKNYEEFQLELPQHFGSVEKELAAMDHSCVCIDFSHYDNLILTGKHAQDFLNRMSTNDLKKLNAQEFMLTVLTNDKGRIIDLLAVYRFDDHLRLILSPQNETHVSQWLEKYIIMDDVKIERMAGGTILLGLIGTQSSELLTKLARSAPPQENQIIAFDYGGHKFIASRSYQLDNGFLIMADPSAVETLLRWIAEQKIPWCGMEAYHAARIEQKKPILRRELTEKYNPLEAGLTQAISFTKGCYIGQEVIARLDSYQKVQKHLLKLNATGSISIGDKILKDNHEIGVVTSSIYSHKLHMPIALGFVKTEFTSSNEPIHIQTKISTVRAEFYP